MTAVRHLFFGFPEKRGRIPIFQGWFRTFQASFGGFPSFSGFGRICFLSFRALGGYVSCLFGLWEVMFLVFSGFGRLCFLPFRTTCGGFYAIGGIPPQTEDFLSCFKRVFSEDCGGNDSRIQKTLQLNPLYPSRYKRNFSFVRWVMVNRLLSTAI